MHAHSLPELTKAEEGAEHAASSKAEVAPFYSNFITKRSLQELTEAEDGAEHAASSEAEMAPVWSNFSIQRAADAYTAALDGQFIHRVQAEQDASCFDQPSFLGAQAIRHHLEKVLSLLPSQEGSEPPFKKKRRRSRGGERHKYERDLAGRDGFLLKRIGLCLRAHRVGEALSNRGFGIAEDGLYSETGWQGRAPPIQDSIAITAAYKSGAIRQILQDSFYPVRYSLQKPRPAFLLDQKSRTYAYRSTQCGWMESSTTQIYGAIDALLRPHLDSLEMAAKCAGGTRGPHFPCIIGHYKQYTRAPTLTQFHSDNRDAVAEFSQTPIIQRINSFVSSLVLTIFPGVAVRFLQSAEWHDEHHGIRPLYGYFWNLCINGMFPGQRRISTVPHSDAKNVVGVCALLVYLIPGKEFDHTSKSWLVLWEAGVVVELPPWVVFLYPSSLLHHFNVDVGDFKFVLTGGERPTPNSRPLGGAGDEGRGSLVYFNQATMYHGPETGHSTLRAAKEAGLSGKVSSSEKASSAFTKHLYG